MKTKIYFYTGTGNSLWLARAVAANLDDVDIIPMKRYREEQLGNAEAVGIFFPVHIWGLPPPVIEFAKLLPAEGKRYHFAAAVNAGQPAATLVQLRKLMIARRVSLDAGFGVAMPSNYIPWGGPGPEAEQARRFAAAGERAAEIAAAVRRRQRQPVEKGPWWSNVLFSALYMMGNPYVPKMDGKFWIDGRCTGCELCARICPAGNIVLIGGRPVWRHRCEQCLACIQWCPAEAIQYGKKTPGYKRYRHPEVSVADMLAAVPERKEV